MITALTLLINAAGILLLLVAFSTILGFAVAAVLGDADKLPRPRATDPTLSSRGGTRGRGTPPGSVG